MKWIIITPPYFFGDEALRIEEILEAGIDLLHLRKPDSSGEDCERLILQIPQKWHHKIVVHDHFELCEKYHLHGIHLNRRNHAIPEHFEGSISRSCHGVEELKAIDSYDYVFLSPIFDSISKQGYHHAFTKETLDKAAEDGIINGKVIALGGVTQSNLPQLKTWHFGGAAFLGDVWNRRNDETWREYLANLKKKFGS